MQLRCGRWRLRDPPPPPLCACAATALPALCLQTERWQRGEFLWRVEVRSLSLFSPPSLSRSPAGCCSLVMKRPLKAAAGRKCPGGGRVEGGGSSGHGLRQIAGDLAAFRRWCSPVMWRQAPGEGNLQTNENVLFTSWSSQCFSLFLFPCLSFTSQSLRPCSALRCWRSWRIWMIRKWRILQCICTRFI